MTADAGGDADVRFPSVPDERLADGGWDLVEESVETVFELPGLAVRGATRLFRDVRTARLVAETTDSESPRGGDADQGYWRFFSATSLSFEPPLPAGPARSLLVPMVRTRATAAFREDLGERGLRDVRRVGTDRIRHDSGQRVPLTRFHAHRRLDEGGSTTPVVGCVAAWNGDGFRVGTGAYPGRPVAETLGLDDAPAPLVRGADEYESELTALIAEIA